MPSAVRIVTALASAVPSLPLSMSRMRPSNDVASVKSMPKLPVLKLPRVHPRPHLIAALRAGRCVEQIPDGEQCGREFAHVHFRRFERRLS